METVEITRGDTSRPEGESSSGYRAATAAAVHSPYQPIHLGGSNPGLKIAMIGSRGLWSDYGGIERVLSELGPRLANRGHQVDVFSRLDAVHRDDIPNLRNVPTAALPGKYTETLSRSIMATLGCMRSSYDVINYHAVGSGILTPVSRMIAPVTVVTLHGLDWVRAKWPAIAKGCLQLAATVIAKQADEVVATSRSQQSYFKNKFGCESVFIPNAVPTPGEVDPSLLAQFGLQPQNYVFFAARLVPEKAAHELIPVYNSLDTDKKLVIAGDNVHEPEYVASLKQIADPTKVTFTGQLRGPVLNTLFANAYLFVNTSHIEGMSMALMEALAFGVPSLVSDIPENTNVIDEHGFTFRTGDAEDLRTQLSILLSDPERVAATRTALARYVPTLVTWDSAAEMLEAVFLNAVTRKRRERWSASVPPVDGSAEFVPPAAPVLERRPAEDGAREADAKSRTAPAE